MRDARRVPLHAWARALHRIQRLGSTRASRVALGALAERFSRGSLAASLYRNLLRNSLLVSPPSCGNVDTVMSSQFYVGNSSWVRPPVPPDGCVCPACKRRLYNRRLAACGFCGAAIPAELRFTSGQIQAIDREWTQMEDDRRQRENAAGAAAHGTKVAVTAVLFPFSF